MGLRYSRTKPIDLVDQTAAQIKNKADNIVPPGQIQEGSVVNSNQSLINNETSIPVKVESKSEIKLTRSKEELKAAIPYLCVNINRNLESEVDPWIELEILPSILDSAFLEGKNMGLFTKDAITKGTIIMKVVREEGKMNDGVVDLEPILRASTSMAMYDAWINFSRTYYDLEKIKRVVNVRMVCDSTKTFYYEAIQDIPAGEELLRIYGFTTWTLELLDILTNKNIVGFMQFIKELAEDIDGDPYEEKIKKLNKGLCKFRTYDDIMGLTPGEFDTIASNQWSVYLGNTIKVMYTDIQ